MKFLALPFSLATVLFVLGGCIHDLPSPSQQEMKIPDAFDAGHLFSLHGCNGIEVAEEWLGPHGPNGPASPPASWRDPYSQLEFTWTMELLSCHRLGWGHLEQGPLWIGMEFHNAYNIPAACTTGLEKTAYTRYLHAVYLDAPPVLDFAKSWDLPAFKTSFYRSFGAISENIVFQIEPQDGSTSIINLNKNNMSGGEAASISVAFFWFDGNLVHRLYLQRDTNITVGDVAILSMAPPTMAGDRPISRPATASWLSELSWSGHLVTFSDANCTTQVFP